MLRIITGFLLLIISQISYADTIAATSSSTDAFFWSTGGRANFSNATESCQDYAAYLQSTGANRTYVSADPGVFGVSTGSCNMLANGWAPFSVPIYINKSTKTTYSCLSGYFLSDASGHSDSSGSYCTKESCTTKTGTNQMVEIANGETAPVTGCYQGCSGTNLQYLYDNKVWTCAAGSGLSCAYNMQFDGNSCTVSSSSGSSAASGSSGDGCGGNGSSTGSVNGQPVTVCNAAPSSSSSDSNTNTSSNTSPGTDSPSSGLGTDAGTPETNTSGTQTGTVGGGVGGLGGDGYGEGGSAGGGGTDSGGASGGTSGSSGGTDSGGTSGGTSGSSGGTDSGGTSGGTSGAGGGSGGGTDSGTGAATSGAGGTDSGTPSEEEEESGDGGGSFSAPGKGTDYLKDVFGESDLSALATDNAELTTKINQKMADVKSVFNLGSLSVSGDMPENQQEIKGASVDLSGRSIFERFSIVAAAFYLCAIATAIYIVMGGKK